MGEVDGEAGSFRTRADVVEYLGNEELLHVSAADQDIVAIVDSDHRVRARATSTASRCRSRSCGSRPSPARPSSSSRLRRLPDGRASFQRHDGPGGALRGRSAFARRWAAYDRRPARTRRRTARRPSRRVHRVPRRHRGAGRRLARDPRLRRPSRGGHAIVAVDAAGRVALVRQWRRATNDALLEIPAGGLGISPMTGRRKTRSLAAAGDSREEGAGLRAGTWRKLGAFSRHRASPTD